MRRIIDRIVTILEMIKFPHTIFALPFAIMSAFLAADGLPTIRQLFWILICMVSARSAAMSFNRIADARLDAMNPRTAAREIPTGKLAISQTAVFMTVMVALFVFSAYQLNMLAFILSPIALFIILGYSHTKRFTNYSHFVLGLALAIAPVGAWIAVREELHIVPLLLGLAVLLWTAGFDIIYACQDVEFDERVGLFSMPKYLGIAGALALSALLHASMVGVLLVVFFNAQLGNVFLSGVLCVSALLLYEHSIVKPDDLSRVNAAFFNVNGAVSLLLMLLTIIDIAVR
ncbi:MAG: 4-hydroxybenzoate octaprenyltransferase [Candidatus Abyssobacteria bacterium SURF_17]|uniref:4-hydroxybenzoate polyprenyltransferase n=1 Tax=Candidatus Abyssobacteria bacterium SURF_17 TaxID=2093361 RepID=A0A419ESX5_9BACT|nr:MAG: 4-hydroxybenzoate octaprenyltransferase [Candidatus Abyssubacteria bacterium SURF_17]